MVFNGFEMERGLVMSTPPQPSAKAFIRFQYLMTWEAGDIYIIDCWLLMIVGDWERVGLNIPRVFCINHCFNSNVAVRFNFIYLNVTKSFVSADKFF